ncbi:hypothetical protein VVR12_09960 [Rothia sp. LK2588]|uniref:hypothetical protein n=1 Tax=Rothia sp. LK2588 TaxID=3114369 RepID=UPI0034CDBC7C
MPLQTSQPPSTQQLSDREIERQRTSLRLFNRGFMAAALVGFLLLSYAGWFIAAALVFLLIAIVCGIVALVKMAKIRATAADFTLTALLLVSCFFMAFSAVVQLIFIEQTNEYARCTNSALTISRQAQCQKQLEDSMLGTLLGK